jgi:hypothetical protein
MLNIGRRTYNFILTSFLATDRLFPEYDIWSDFLVRERIEAQKLDILASSHPIEIPGGVTHPGQVNNNDLIAVSGT